MVKHIFWKQLLFFLFLLPFGALSAQNCVGVSINFPFNSDTLTLCQGQDGIDLDDYVSAPGGVFSGIGILGNGFEIEGIAEGVYEIMYVLGTDTCIKHIEISPINFEFPVTHPNFNLDGGFWAGCNNESAIDFSEFVAPPGGTFSGSSMIDSIFYPSLVNALPGDIEEPEILYSVDGVGECAKLQKILVIGAPDYEVEILEPQGNDLVLCSNSGGIPLMGTLPPGANPAASGFYPSSGGFSNFIANDTLDPLTLNFGHDTLIYIYLEGSCRFVDSISYEMINIDDSNYTPAEITIESTTLCELAEPFALTAFPEGGVFSSDDLTLGVDNIIDAEVIGIGEYEVFYSLGNEIGNCGLRDTTTITVLESIDVDYDLELSACNRIPDKLTYIGAQPLENIDLSWSLSEGEIVENQNDSLVLIDWDFPGQYTLTLSFPEGSCVGSSNDLVFDVPARTVDQDTCLISTFIPNAFTPNEDGVNDVFKIEGQGIESATLYIYDRFGGNLFEGADWRIGWDGTWQNEYVRAGVYFYFAEIKLEDGTEVLKKGDVTLIR